MSRSIDERIVEMRFDNQQFENKAKESIQTLGKLKDALEMDKSAKQFDTLGEAVNNISFDGLAAGVQALQDRFSTWGIVSMRIIQNVTDSMIRLVTNGVNFVSDAIVSGGLRRAQNIENAHFQLQALLKDEARVQQYMNDAMDSVDGTAYAYDEAAKAAAQFAASGVAAGEDVSRALKGITGVAAMTNADYESISQIFTTVAGNGRLMGDQLLQLSSRGMNAAATIADYFQQVKGQSDATEATIRDMVSKGKISFEDFAAAMNWAFGDQAKRANETFNGAFANMKAAFARIGAGFFSPLIEQNSDLVLLLNSLRVRINDVKSALVFDEQASAISGLTKQTGLAESELKELFNTISTNGSVSMAEITKLSNHGVDAIEKIQNYINGVQDGTIRASYATKTAIQEMTGGLEVSSSDIARFVEEGKINLSIFTSAMETAYGDIHTLTYQFTNWVLDWAKKLSTAIDNADLSGPLQAFDDLVEAAKAGFKNLYSLIRPIGQAFRESLSVFDKTKYNVVKATGAIKSFVQSLKPSEKTIQNIHDLFKGVFDVIGVLVRGFGSLLKAILPISGPMNDVAGGFLDIAGSIGRGLSSLAQWISSSETLRAVYSGLSSVIKVACQWISNGVKLIGDFVNKVKNMQIVQDIISGIGAAFNKLGDIFKAVKVNFAPFKSVFDFLSSIANTVGPVILKVFNGIGKALGSLAEGFKNVMGASSGGDLADVLNVGFFTYVLAMLDTWIGRLTAAATNITKIPAAIVSVMYSVRDVLISFQGAIKADIIQKIAVAIATLAGSMLVLSLIDSGRLADSLAVMSGLLLEVFGLMKSLGSVIGSKNPFAALTSYLDSFYQTKVIQSVAKSVLILAGALYVISKIDKDKLFSSFAVISGLVIEMGALVKVLSSPFVGKLKTGIMPVIALASAILILAVAAKRMSSLKWEELAKGLAGVGALMTEVALFMAASKKFGSFGVGSAVSIILLAAAINLLEGPIMTFSKMPLMDIAKGLGTLAGALGLIVAAFNLMPDSGSFGNGVSIVLLAAAIKMLEEPLMTFSKMSLTEMGKGLLALAGALGAIVLAFNLMPSSGSFGGAVSILLAAEAVRVLQDAVMSFATLGWEQIGAGLATLAGSLLALALGAHAMEGAIGGAAAMLVMAAAVRVLALALMAFGGMSAEQIAKSLITLAGAFIIMGVAGAALSSLIPVILGLSGAMALFGAGMFAFGAGLTMIAASATAAAAAIVGVVGIIIVGILDLIISSTKKIGEAVLTLIVTVCDVIAGSVGKIAETVFALVESVLTTLADHAPEIVTQLIRLIVGIIDALSEHIPELIQSVVNFASTFFGAIIDVLNDLDSDALQKALEGFEMMAVIMAALAGLSMISSAAMAGVIEMGVVIGELAVLLAAIGALKQIPGLQWLINEGGDMLLSVGQAIGKFVGGIVGGAMEGMSASLPAIGQNLTDFMTNATGFIEGASKIDSTLMDGVKSLAEVVLVLTAADILDGLTSWFTGGVNLADFGQELANFAPYIASYSRQVAGIDSSVVEASANAALCLSEMVQKLPPQDGILEKIFGSKSLSDFGQELEDFAPHISSYAQGVAGVSPEAVEASASAATILSDMASKLPNNGGLSALIFGENKLSDFGLELEKFGPSIANYAATVSGIDTDAVTCSANVAQLLSDLANGLPNEGGLLSWFQGDNTLSDFGDDLVDFGDDLMSYYEAIAGIDTVLMTAVIASIRELIDLFNSIGSVTTEPMLNFVNGLEQVGNTGIDSFVNAFTNASGRVSTAINTMISNSLAAVDSRSSDFSTKGTTCITNFEQAIRNGSPAVTSVVTIMMENIITQISLKIPQFSEKGKACADQFVNAIRLRYGDAMSAGSTLSYNAYIGVSSSVNSFAIAGINAAIGFVNGLNSQLSSATSAGRALGNAALNAARAALDEHSPSRAFYEIGDLGGIGFVNALLDSAKSAYDAGSEIGDSSLSGVMGAIRAIQSLIEDQISVDPVISPILDLSNLRNGSNMIASMLDNSIGMTLADASMISVPVRRFGGFGSVGDFQNGDGYGTFTTEINNTFYVQSRDPQGVANETSRIIQRQIERRDAANGRVGL